MKVYVVVTIEPGDDMFAGLRVFDSREKAEAQAARTNAVPGFVYRDRVYEEEVIDE